VLTYLRLGTTCCPVFIYDGTVRKAGRIQLAFTPIQVRRGDLTSDMAREAISGSEQSEVEAEKGCLYRAPSYVQDDVFYYPMVRMVCPKGSI
jgi:hypothetical protein